MAASDRRGDPLLARASPGGWAAWLRALGERGDADLAAFGLTLAVGFAAGLLALYLFAALAYEVMRQQTDLLDLGVLALLQQFKSPALDALAWAVSLMGSQAVSALRGRWGAAVGLVLVTGGAQLLNDVLKGEFHRVRPAPVLGMIPVQAFSFPSGHAMVSAAFYGFLAYLSWRVLRGWWRTASTLALL